MRTLLLTLLAMTTAALNASTPATWTNEHGDQLHYDGVFYSFRSADGVSAFKIWTPPQDEPIRGLILFGNPGGGFGGDTRDKTRQQDILTFAGRRGLAVGGVNGFPGRDTYATYGRHILNGLDAMAAHGAHSELATIPMIVTGGSNAGSFAYSMACFAPARTIGITPNVGGYFSTEPPAAALDVPMWIHIGALDPLSTTGVERTEELFRYAWQQGQPLWTWDAEMKGHENGSADHVDVAFWDAMLDARLPATPGQPLRPLPFDEGWLADLRSWDHRITRIFPATELPADASPGRYGWIPNHGLARLYQATATRSRPLLLSLEQPSPENAGTGTSGVYLSAGLSTIVDPGDEVILRLDTVPLAFGVQTVEIWDVDGELGEVDFGNGEDRFAFTVDGAKRVYSLFAYARVERWGTVSERVSAPLQLIVRDPAVSARIRTQLAAESFPALLPRVARAPQAIDPALTPLPAAHTLNATWLANAPGDPLSSDLWAGAPAPVIATPEVDDPVVRLATQARWSASGLHLRFRVTDPEWSPATASLFDTIDFHLATTDPARLAVYDPGHYVMPAVYSLLRGAVQMQIPVGEAELTGDLFVNYWTPWDPQRATLRAAENFADTGIRTRITASAADTREVTLFLPWHAVGLPGLTTAPPADTRLSFCLLYTDEASGQKIAWPRGLNPWAQRPGDDQPSPFGQLQLVRD